MMDRPSWPYALKGQSPLAWPAVGGEGKAPCGECGPEYFFWSWSLLTLGTPTGRTFMYLHAET
jgi:hypothetical protein